MSLMSRFLGTPALARSPIWLYRLGFGGLMGSRMLMLEHTGRKSGEARYVVLEVARREHDDALVLASGFGVRSQWFKNLQANPSCRVWVGWKRGVPARAAFLSEEESADILEEYKVNHAAMWKRLKQAIEEITGEAPTSIPMVRLHLRSST